MKNVESKYVIVMDPSTTLTADAISPVLTELNKGEFVAVGWKGGLVNLADDWRSTEDKGDGEVDVLFSYFMAVDRVAALEVGGFNARAIYYYCRCNYRLNKVAIMVITMPTPHIAKCNLRKITIESSNASAVKRQS
jgi:hypothetical protein